MKVCIEPGCPTLTHDTRCPEHARERDKARGSRQERGYDAAHDRLRAHYVALQAEGHTLLCARCHEPIRDEPFDLGHDDHDRTRYTGPEHVRCNRATAARGISPDG